MNANKEMESSMVMSNSTVERPDESIIWVNDNENIEVMKDSEDLFDKTDLQTSRCDDDPGNIVDLSAAVQNLNDTQLTAENSK